MKRFSISQLISQTKSNAYRRLSRIGSTPGVDWPIVVVITLACVIGVAWKGFDVYINVKNPAEVTGEAGAFGAEAFSQANLKKAIEAIDKKTSIREAARRGYSVSADPSL